MTARQRRQLQSVEDTASAMVAELDPRIILPSVEKQRELGIAEETLLIPAGPRRAITMSAGKNGGWSIKEFDTSDGNLTPVWEEAGELTDDLVVAVVLGASVGSMQEQLAFTGAQALSKDQQADLKRLIGILQPRHTQLVEQGIDSFEFEAVAE